MSVSASTVPAVKAKLLEMFKAATDGEQTEVWPVRPGEEHQLAENVYIADVRGSREWKTLGAGALSNQREETYEVAVEVEVFREGTDSEGTEARMWEIVLALEEAIAQDKTLTGVENVQWVLVAHFNQSTQAVAEGVLAKTTFGVAVVARI
jgi:hypothetical protein